MCFACSLVQWHQEIFHVIGGSCRVKARFLPEFSNNRHVLSFILSFRRNKTVSATDYWNILLLCGTLWIGTLSHCQWGLAAFFCECPKIPVGTVLSQTSMGYGAILPDWRSYSLNGTDSVHCIDNLLFCTPLSPGCRLQVGGSFLSWREWRELSIRSECIPSE